MRSSVDGMVMGLLEYLKLENLGTMGRQKRGVWVNWVAESSIRRDDAG